MLSQNFHTLVEFLNNLIQNNRTLQWRVVVVISETTVNPIITQELSHDGGVVPSYCIVHCGVVPAALSI